jgi:hypothetical protein
MGRGGRNYVVEALEAVRSGIYLGLLACDEALVPDS